jgi:hypothetical protein
MSHLSLFVSGIHINIYVDLSTLASFKCHLIFEAFDGFVSPDAFVTLLADRGLVGDVGGVLIDIDLVRLSSLIDSGIARNNLKSNVSKLVMENEPF